MPWLSCIKKSRGNDVRKSTVATKTNTSRLSPLTVKARSSNAVAKKERYMSVQSWAANSKLKIEKIPKNGRDVGG
jgi:hypothetical protein